jgi:5-(carboxyamino)imidazole ribonucleotide synthase
VDYHNAGELPAALAASGVPACWKNACRWREFALTLARSPSGAISALPLVQNWHSGGILDQTRSPANVPALEPTPSASPSTSSPPSTTWAC